MKSNKIKEILSEVGDYMCMTILAGSLVATFFATII